LSAVEVDLPNQPFGITPGAFFVSIIYFLVLYVVWIISSCSFL